MKTSLYLTSTVALLLTVAAPNARSQNNVSTEPKHLERLTPQGNLVQFVAATIGPYREGLKQGPQRIKLPDEAVRMDGAQRPNRIGALGSMIYLEGDVEITIYNRALMLHTSTHDALTKEMVITADEAVYNVDTGEIQPRGHVSIKFQNVESAPK